MKEKEGEREGRERGREIEAVRQEVRPKVPLDSPSHWPPPNDKRILLGARRVSSLWKPGVVQFVCVIKEAQSKAVSSSLSRQQVTARQHRIAVNSGARSVGVPKRLIVVHCQTGGRHRKKRRQSKSQLLARTVLEIESHISLPCNGSFR